MGLGAGFIASVGLGCRLPGLELEFAGVRRGSTHSPFDPNFFLRLFARQFGSKTGTLVEPTAKPLECCPAGLGVFVRPGLINCGRRSGERGADMSSDARGAAESTSGATG